MFLVIRTGSTVVAVSSRTLLLGVNESNTYTYCSSSSSSSMYLWFYYIDTFRILLSKYIGTFYVPILFLWSYSIQ